MSDMTLLRIGIAVAMTLLLGAIIFFGRGRRNERGQRPRSREPERIEPDTGAAPLDEAGAQEELALDGSPAPSELGKRVTVRLLVVTTWGAYTLIFIKIILPFCILASQLGFDTEGTVTEGIGYVFFALVLLGLSVHLHTILARLFFLRPRVFGGEEAILVN